MNLDFDTEKRDSGCDHGKIDILLNENDSKSKLIMWLIDAEVQTDGKHFEIDTEKKDVEVQTEITLPETKQSAERKNAEVQTEEINSEINNEFTTENAKAKEEVGDFTERTDMKFNQDDTTSDVGVEEGEKSFFEDKKEMNYFTIYGMNSRFEIANASMEESAARNILTVCTHNAKADSEKAAKGFDTARKELTIDINKFEGEVEKVDFKVDKIDLDVETENSELENNKNDTELEIQRIGCVVETVKINSEVETEKMDSDFENEKTDSKFEIEKVDFVVKTEKTDSEFVANTNVNFNQGEGNSGAEMQEKVSEDQTETSDIEIRNEERVSETHTENHTAPTEKAGFKVNTENNASEVYTEKIDPELDSEKIDPELEAEEFDPGLDTEKIDPGLDTEKIDPELDIEKTDPALEAEKIGPELDTEKIDPELEAEKIDPELEAEEIDPELDTEKIDPALDTENIDPALDTEKIDPELEGEKIYPALDTEKMDAQKIDPGLDTEKIDPALDTEKIDPELDTEKMDAQKIDPGLDKEKIDSGMYTEKIDSELDAEKMDIKKIQAENSPLKVQTEKTCVEVTTEENTDTDNDKENADPDNACTNKTNSANNREKTGSIVSCISENFAQSQPENPRSEDILVSTVVIDAGSRIVKAGFAGDEDPKAKFPNVIGAPKRIAISLQSGKNILEVAENAEKKAPILNLRYPVVNGLITWWGEMEEIIYHALSNELDVDVSQYVILMTSETSDGEQLLEMLFRRFKPLAVLLVNQATLSLFASGRSTGVVINFGEGTSQVVPIYEKCIIQHAVKKWGCNGLGLTKKLMEMLDISETSAGQLCAREIKEKYCYVAIDPQAEIENVKYDQCDLPDGREITIGPERFQCPEVLFQDYCIHKIVVRAIQYCDRDIQRDFFKNIVLAGGSTMLPGFPERLEKEIRALVGEEIEVNVIAPPDRNLSAWKGGSRITSTDFFHCNSISIDEYKDNGSRVFHTKPL